MHRNTMAQLSKLLRHHHGFLLLTSILVFMASPLGAESAELPPSVTQALKEAGIPLSSIAVVVHGVDAEHALVRHNAQQAMNPASA